MGNEQKINEFVDFAALDKERLRLIEEFKNMFSELQATAAKGKISFTGDAKSITEGTKAIQENEQAAKKQKETIDKTTEAYIKQKQISDEVTRLKKIDVATTNEQISAYARLKAEAAKATDNYRNLAAQYGKNSTQARAAGKEAANLNNKIADINKTAGISNNLVGRYTEGIMSAVKKVGAAIVAAFAFDKIVGFFKSGLDMSIKWEERNARMLFTLNGNQEAFDRMSAKATELSKTSLFKKSDIADAQILALQLGRSEEQTNKMITAAMGLARVTGVDLTAAMQTMSMTLEGSKGRLGRIVGEVKNMSEEELKAGKAIDIVNERFGKFGKEGLETTGGKLIMLSKEFNGFKRKLVEGTDGKGAFDGLVEGAKSLVGWLNKNVTVVGKIIIEIARFLTVVVAWKVGTMAAAAAQAVWTAATNLYTIVANRAKTATMALNTAQKSNIWGLVAAAIALAATYLVKFSGSMSEAQKKTEDFKKSLTGAVGESNSLFEQLKKTNPGTKERADLIGLINEKYGEYIKGIDLENAGLREIEAAQAAVNNELITNLTLKAKQAEISTIAQAQADILRQLGEKNVFLNDLTEGKGALKKYVIWADQEIQSLSDGYFQLQRQINDVGKIYDDIADGIRKSLIQETTLTQKSTKEKDKNTKATKEKAAAIEKAAKNETEYVSLIINELKVQREYHDELKSLNNSYVEGIIDTKEYNKQLHDLYITYGQAGTEIQKIDTSKFLDAFYKAAEEGKIEALKLSIKELAEELDKLFSAENFGFIDDSLTNAFRTSFKEISLLIENFTDKDFNKLEGAVTAFAEIMQSVFQAINENLASSVDQNLKRLDEQYNANQKHLKATLDLQLQDESLTNEQRAILQAEYDGKIAILEEEKAAREKQLNHDAFEKQRQLALANAAIMGIQASLASYMNGAQLGGPVMGSIYSAIAGLFAVAQAALIAAEPNPYWKGRWGGPEETAITGDRGFEYISDNTGLFKTPNKATLTHLNAGAIVYPHEMSLRIDRALNMPTVATITKVPESENNKEILRELRAIKNKPTMSFNINKNGFDYYIYNGHSRSKFVNKHIMGYKI